MDRPDTGDKTGQVSPAVLVTLVTGLRKKTIEVQNHQKTADHPLNELCIDQIQKPGPLQASAIRKEGIIFSPNVP